MQLDLDPEEFRPLIEAIVVETLTRVPQLDSERLAYPESEAAALLGINSHQLRDARLRREITSTKVGGRIAYERTELLAYLARGRSN